MRGSQYEFSSYVEKEIYSINKIYYAYVKDFNINEVLRSNDYCNRDVMIIENRSSSKWSEMNSLVTFKGVLRSPI